MNQDSFIKELGRSYIISSFLPATFFCLIMLLLFQEFIPAEWQKKVEEANVSLLIQMLLMGVVPIWVAFFLFSSVDWIVKVFEGYYFPKLIGKMMKKAKHKEFKKKTQNFRSIKKFLQKNVGDRTRKESDIYDTTILSAASELKLIEIDMPFTIPSPKIT